MNDGASAPKSYITLTKDKYTKSKGSAWREAATLCIFILLMFVTYIVYSDRFNLIIMIGFLFNSFPHGYKNIICGII